MYNEIDGMSDGMLDHFFKFDEDELTVENGIVNCEGNISVKKIITKLPATFGEVKGTFNCMKNSLTTLLGSPKVAGSFYAYRNNLQDLIGSPVTVAEVYSVTINPLTSLEGLPKEIGGELWLSYDRNLPLLRLMTCKWDDLNFSNINNHIVKVTEMIYSLIQKKESFTTKELLWAFQKELSDAGFSENARW
jgi:hypothetical protein